MQSSERNWKLTGSWKTVVAVVVAALMVVGGGYVAYAHGGAGFAGNDGAPREAVETAIADALGLTVDELSDQLWAGRTLADLAEAASVDIADLRTAAEGAQDDYRMSQIQAAVEAGDMTQEQADWMIEGIEQGYMPGGQYGRGMGSGMSYGEGYGMGSGMYQRGMMGSRGFGGRGYGDGFSGNYHSWGGYGMGDGMGYGYGMGDGECDGECDGYGPGTGMYGGRGMMGRPYTTPDSDSE